MIAECVLDTRALSLGLLLGGMGVDYTLEGPPRGRGCTASYCRASFCRFFVAWGGLSIFFICIVVGLVLATSGNKCGVALAATGAGAAAAGAAATGRGRGRGLLFLRDDFVGRQLAATNSTDGGGISTADGICISMFVLAALGLFGFAAPACCNCREWYCGWIKETSGLKRVDSMVHVDRDGHAIEKRDSDMVWG